MQSSFSTSNFLLSSNNNSNYNTSITTNINNNNSTSNIIKQELNYFLKENKNSFAKPFFSKYLLPYTFYSTRYIGINCLNIRIKGVNRDIGYLAKLKNIEHYNKLLEYIYKEAKKQKLASFLVILVLEDIKNKRIIYFTIDIIHFIIFTYKAYTTFYIDNFINRDFKEDILSILDKKLLYSTFS